MMHTVNRFGASLVINLADRMSLNHKNHFQNAEMLRHSLATCAGLPRNKYMATGRGAATRRLVGGCTFGLYRRITSVPERRTRGAAHQQHKTTIEPHGRVISSEFAPSYCRTPTRLFGRVAFAIHLNCARILVHGPSAKVDCSDARRRFEGSL